MRLLIVYHVHYKAQALRLRALRRSPVLDVVVEAVDDATNTATDVAGRIDHVRARTEGLLYVCLVGNEDEVQPVMLRTETGWGGGTNTRTSASDLALTFGREHIYRPDSYPENLVDHDIVVGRLTTGSTEAGVDQRRRNVDNQLDKMYEYAAVHADPACPPWVRHIIGIASNETDESSSNRYTKLTDRGWLKAQATPLVSKGYDLRCYFDTYARSAGRDAIAQGFNQGASFMCYVGHGDELSITTSGFRTSDVDQLSNRGKYPFCVFVACSVGSFDEQDVCLTEQLQVQAGAGSICACGSTKKQTWTPPMAALERMLQVIDRHAAAPTVDAASRAELTCGGIFHAGLARLYGDHCTSRSDTCDRDDALTWIFLGDPSTPLNTTRRCSGPSAPVEPDATTGSEDAGDGGGLFIIPIIRLDSLIKVQFRAAHTQIIEFRIKKEAPPSRRSPALLQVVVVGGIVCLVAHMVLHG
jgi:hypothetical protein